MPPKAAASKKQSSPLRVLFAVEAAMNVVSGLQLMLIPNYTLNQIIVPLTAKNAAAGIMHPASLGTSPVALQLVQFMGAVIMALTVPLLYGISEPASTTGSKSTTSASSPKPTSPSALLAQVRAQGIFRRRTYIMLATGEVFLAVLLISHLVLEKEAEGRPGALKPGFLLGALLVMMNLAAARAWAIICRDHWFGGLGARLSAGVKKEL